MEQTDVSRDLHRLVAPRVVALACSLLGAASVVAVSWRYGLGASIDGVVYLASARHLLEGHGFTDLRGDPLIIFPPLFPLAIAAIGAFVSSVDIAARILQTTLFVGNYLLAATLLARYVTDRRILTASLVLLLVSRTFLLYHFFVLSEALFVFLTLGMLVALLRWIDHRGRGLIMLAAALAGLSCLTRYVGVANVLTGLLVIGWWEKQWPRRVRLSALFATLAVVPLLAWLARNMLLGSSLTGERLPSPYPLLLNLRLVADGIALWFIPDEVYPALRVTVVVATTIFCLVMLMRMSREADSSTSLPTGLLVTSISAHLLVLIVATTILASDFITTRFVMPFYVPVVILIALILSWIVQRHRFARPFVAAFFALWILIQLVTATKSIVSRQRDGVGGFATREWHESKVMQFIRSHPDSLGTDLYSNAGVGVSYWGGPVVNFLPDRLNPRWRNDYPLETLAGRPSMGDLLSEATTPGRSVILIWFNIMRPDPRYESIFLFNEYDFESIRNLFHVVPIAEFDDGGVYRLLAPDG